MDYFSLQNNTEESMHTSLPQPTAYRNIEIVIFKIPSSIPMDLYLPFAAAFTALVQGKYFFTAF